MGEGSYIILFPPSDVTALHKIVQGVVFFTWIGILIFGTIASIDPLGLMMQKKCWCIFFCQYKTFCGFYKSKYRMFHINRDIVFQLMLQNIACDPLKFAELRGNTIFLVLLI